MGMIINTDKPNFMIIKSKKDTYANFIYDNRNIKEATSYKYLKIDIHHKLIGTITLRKGLMEGGNLILVLKITVNQPMSCLIKISSSSKLLSSLLSYMVVKYMGASFL